MRVEYEDPRAYGHVMVQGVVLDKHVSDSFYNYIVLRDDGFIDEVAAVECKVIEQVVSEEVRQLTQVDIPIINKIGRNLHLSVKQASLSPIKKDRYDPNEFVGFIVAVKTLARGLDCRFMVKDSMYKQAETFEGAYRDLCVRNLDEIKKIYEISMS